MRAHYFQHVAFEGLGSIESWLKAQGFELSRTAFYQSAELPDPQGIDLLVVMGGPMSVNDEAKWPWLRAEKQFIGDFIAQGKPVLGICLGAQLIANALGGRVFANAEKEIGWWPVHSVVHSEASLFAFPEQLEVFHWHGETFELPAEASVLARSAACAHQAFQLGERVIGLQFHLEMTPESVRQIVDQCRDELRPAPYVQDEARILAADPAQYQAINALMGQVLQFLLRP